MAAPLYRSRPGGFEIQPARESAARRVAEDVYVSEGLSNTYLVRTSDGRVVINTGMGFEAPVHRRHFDAVDDGPVRYVILTQGHVDHVGGLGLWSGEGTEIVAQANHAGQLADDARIARFRASRSAFAFGDVISRALRHLRDRRDAALPSRSAPEPTITFQDRFDFELGGVRFQLLSTPGGETTDSLVVWLPDRRLCFTGNLFSALFGHFPNLVTIRGDRYRDPLRFVASLERVLALEPELLLVGHHQPVEGASRIRAELERLRGAVLYVHDETVRGMNAGVEVESLMREIRLPPDLEVGEGYGKVSWCVRAIWETYAGWFHHRSTTELYPVPAARVYPDLVALAGGPDAVAKRARERLAAGESLEAIHLSEVALGAEPRHPASLEVSLAAHERLEAESENFWLTSWLRKQIAALRERDASR